MDTQVTIYSTPTCHFCHLAKDFFDANGVMYEDVDVVSNLERRKEMVDMTGQLGVPVIRIGDDVVVGFDEPKLRQLLQIA